MQRITLDARVDQISAELGRHGIAADARVHVTVELISEPSGTPAMGAIAQAGGAFDWLEEEPDLYTDADLAGATPFRPG